MSRHGLGLAWIAAGGWAALAGALLLALCGCTRAPDKLDPYVQAAAANRAGGAASLVAAFRAGNLTFDEVVTKAHDLLEAGQDATAFAGAVLDMAVAIEGTLPKGGEFEIFWFRVGRLAYRATEKAAMAGRIDEAQTLVFAGPDRWRTEGYWIRYPDHDAMASRLLYLAGRTSEAIQRLEDRGVLQGPAEEELEWLRTQR